MRYRKAEPFDNDKEYKIFRNKYCSNNCKHHKERDNGYIEFTERGGCPIEDKLESAKYNIIYFPDMILEVWEDDKCMNWYHCPFYEKKSNK